MWFGDVNLKKEIPVKILINYHSIFFFFAFYVVAIRCAELYRRGDRHVKQIFSKSFSKFLSLRSLLRDFPVVRQPADAGGHRRLRAEPDAHAHRVRHGDVSHVRQHVHGLLHGFRQDQSHVGRKGMCVHQWQNVKGSFKTESPR